MAWKPAAHFTMYRRPERGSANPMQNRRKRTGEWLRELREKRGLSQRELARRVGAEFYTFISQLEHGWGHVPPDRYLVWATALQIEPQEFVRGLMQHDDPMAYDIIFGDVSPGAPTVSSAQSSKIVTMRRQPHVSGAKRKLKP
jgi:transcriptional regulator with XRE-family HTH domain